MKQYLELIHTVLNEGHEKADRTGTGTISIFGYQMRFDLRKGFPLVTTKKLHLRSIIHELLWFLNGDTNIQYLKDNNVSIWDEWADENGDLGPVYGKQWREWNADKMVSIDDINLRQHLEDEGYIERDMMSIEGEHYFLYSKTIDQIQTIIDQLRNDPDSRRIIVSAWNVGELDQMALAPCHSFFQFYTRKMTLKERKAWLADNDPEAYQFSKCEEYEDDKDEHNALTASGVPERVLSCQLYQRSADVFLGVPFNIASYALLTHLVAHHVGMVAGDFIWTGGDTHLYTNHLEQATLQLTRVPHPLPKLRIVNTNGVLPKTIFNHAFEDFVIEDYESHPPIKAPVAI